MIYAARRTSDLDTCMVLAKVLSEYVSEGLRYVLVFNFSGYLSQTQYTSTVLSTIKRYCTGANRKKGQNYRLRTSVFGFPKGNGVWCTFH